VGRYSMIAPGIEKVQALSHRDCYILMNQPHCPTYQPFTASS